MKKLSPAQLREHKGISFVGVSTCFFCYNNQGRFVMVKRGEGARDERGTWEIPGGGLKWGSTLEENLTRELQEELGAKAKDVQLMGYRDVLRKFDQGMSHWLAMDFAVLVDTKSIKINDPEAISELGWFTLDDLPEPLHSQHPAMFLKYNRMMKDILSSAQKGS